MARKWAARPAAEPGSAHRDPATRFIDPVDRPTVKATDLGSVQVLKEGTRYLLFYNPLSYHDGTVWPHDGSLIAAGCKRYGFHAEASLLAGQMVAATGHFPQLRLPELFCGYDLEASPVPVPYPVACSPQAWAAGSIFLFLEAMLGLRPHADRHELEVAHPELPGWLAEVWLTNLRVGEHTVDLRFGRRSRVTTAEVVRRSPGLDVVIAT
jgi:hypothetical protein